MDKAQIEATLGSNAWMRHMIGNAAAIFAVDQKTAAEYMIFGPDHVDDLPDDSDVLVFILGSRQGELDELLDLLKSLRPDIAGQYILRTRRGSEDDCN